MDRVWTSVAEVPVGRGGCVVTIGVFDGFHRGHLALVRAAREHAGARLVPLVLLTFDPHPRAVLRPEFAPRLLMTLDQRVEMAYQLGVDAVLVLPFTRQLAAVPADVFVNDVLVRGLAADVVVVGQNFRFGTGGAGDVARLEELGRRHGFETEAVAPVAVEGHTCSSTELRRRMAMNDFGGAAALLGRPRLTVAVGP